MFSTVYVLKSCEMGRILIKNSFILGSELNVLKNLKEKYSFLENAHSSLWSVCSDLHGEEASFQDSWVCKTSATKKALPLCSLGSDSRKAVNRCVQDISAYCSISNSLVWSFMRHVKLNPLCYIASNFCLKHFIEFFYRHLNLWNAIS